jgi:hypothetical protein
MAVLCHSHTSNEGVVSPLHLCVLIVMQEQITLWRINTKLSVLCLSWFKIFIIHVIINCMVWNPLIWAIGSQKKVIGWCGIAAYCIFPNWWQLLCWWPCTLEMITHCASSWVVKCHGWYDYMVRWRWIISGFDWIFWLYASCACNFWMCLMFPWLHDVVDSAVMVMFSVREKYLQCKLWK